MNPDINHGMNQVVNDDASLKSLLQEWAVPAAPRSLEASVLEASVARARAPWWRRMFTTMIPVPVPLAVALTVFVAYGAWQGSRGIAATCQASLGTGQASGPMAAPATAPATQPNCASRKEC